VRARNAWLLSIVVLVATGCSAGQPAELVPAQPTPTPLATQHPELSTPRPKATPKATPRATTKAGSFYKPPGWDGSSDVNCKDFDTHAHAQSFFIGTGGSPSNDPYGLDGDHDGKACETLP
jgi:hypothetical protein